MVLDSDERKFNGFARVKPDEHHLTVHAKSPNGNQDYEDTLFLYLPSRSALVLKKIN